MILERLEAPGEDLERRTGWTIRPEGACKGETCVPLPPMHGPTVDVRVLAAHLGMPLIKDDLTGMWCLGPEAEGRVLTTAVAPEVTLPEWRGGSIALGSLRGSKVLLLAWAPW